jgi:hypothetical protein
MSENLVRIQKKKCQGIEQSDRVCNYVTGKWEKLNDINNYVVKLLNKYKDEDYIEYSKKNCEDDDLKRKINKIVGLKSSDFWCNDFTGKWKKIKGMKLVLNPKISKQDLEKLDVSNIIYQYYRQLVERELKKDPSKLHKSKGIMKVKKEFIDERIKEEWLPLKNDPVKFADFKKKHQNAMKERDNKLKELGQDLFISVPVVETGPLRQGSFTGWTLFNNTNVPDSKGEKVNLINKTKLNRELWDKMSFEKQNVWNYKAIEHNKNIVHGQTDLELMAAKPEATKSATKYSATKSATKSKSKYSITKYASKSRSLSSKKQDEIAEAVKLELGEEEHKDFYEFIDDLEDKLNIPIVLKLNNYKEYVQAYTKYEKLSPTEQNNLINKIKESDFVADELHKILNN